MREALGYGRHLSAGDIWLLQLPFTSQSTTSSTSPSLAPSDPLILARAQNTPLSSDTSPPTPMPTSTPSSLAQSLYGTICLATTAVTATSPEAFQVYALPIIRTFCHTLIDPWNLIFNIPLYLFLFFSSIFWIIICVYIRKLWICQCAVRYPVKCILIDILLLASCIVVTLRGLKYK